MKKILIFLILLFCFVSIGYANIHHGTYYAQGIKKGNSSITVNSDGSFSIVPALNLNGNVSQIFGEYKLGFNFDNDGYVQAYDNDTALTAYLNYKNCYGEAKYETSITDSSFHTLYIYTTSVYKKIDFLQDTINSGTGYITWADNDSTYGSCFTIGKYGAGIYEISAELEGTASTAMQCYAVIYVNGVIKATSWNNYASIGRCMPAKQIYLNVGDIISLGFAKRGTSQNDNVAFREVLFRLKRISQ